MIPYERRQQLLQIIEKNEYASMEQLIGGIESASESTIRRDLKALADEGLITLMRGGASRVQESSHDTRVSSRMILHQEAKERIAKCAADMVNKGEVIYIDSGSTTLRMIPYIKDRDITIVTTNTLIFQEFAGGKAECIVVGGSVNPTTGSIVGDMTVSNLESLYFDKAFLGATGISLRAGISTPDIKEAMKKQVIRSNAKHAYVLVDSSKVGLTTMCKVFDLSDVIVIMEKNMDILRECGGYIIAE